MTYLGQLYCRLHPIIRTRPNTLRWRVWRHELGMCLLKGVEFNAQRVVFGVGERWGILNVVATIRLVNGCNEFAIACHWRESLGAHP